MNGKFILDTNIIINVFRGNTNTIQHISTLDDLYVPSVVLGELYFGANKSNFSEKHLTQIEEFKRGVNILSIDEFTAIEYGKIKNHLKKIGRPIPENDIWIAALAKQTNLPLLTNDKHFSIIPDISLSTL